MGVLNTTPDSFSDGGKHTSHDQALAHALSMVEGGAEIIDIGGESTRPGAPTIEADEEMRRTVSLIEALRKQSEVLISIDTSKVSVAAAALEAGADIVNDVTGFRDDRMVQLCADAGVGVCVMHMLGNPRTMQANPSYDHEQGVCGAVKDFFEERFRTLTSQGMDPECICFDPGIGFGKTLEHNLELLRHLEELQQDRPILLGVSRKSFIGALTGEEDPEKRDFATAAVTVLAHQAGIRVHRVHDVTGNIQALQIVQALG